jgi:hypothetical protein
VQNSLYRKPIKETNTQFHPRVEFQGRRFYCNGESFSLSRKPKASKIIKAFMAQQSHCLSRTELLTALFEIGKRPIEISSEDSLSWTRNQSLNRLICRLRGEFQRRFQSVMHPSTEWFYYDTKGRQWILYKLPGECADGKLRA